MRALGRVLVAGLIATAGDASAQPGGPVEAAARFHEATQSGSCAQVWALYSKATQDHIRTRVHRGERERAGAPREEKPEEAQCRRGVGKFKRGTARLVRIQGDEAVVVATFRGAQPRHEFDLAAPFKQWTEEVKLVREDGAWKIDRPREKAQPQVAALVEVGPVDVRIDRPVAGLHQRLEATAVARAPRDKLDAVLRDPTAWATVLPSFKAIEPLERSGGVDRVRLAFADPAPPIAVTVKLLGKPVDPGTAWTALQWNVENDAKAPVYMRGSWNLSPNSDGTTRVNLTLVVDPRHWPDGAGGPLFSAERMANAVRDLEKAALK